ncbi:DUF3558 family protein [Chloroflexus aggregans]|uniref:DUF3558 domain-containing protein n=1 Tax=Chloroflexus aggregans (strain MD-66 / DSM 9485) TaxID=326427 RepID=B8G4Y2_CHLAD|nr:DUF3558 family protein [Chloroflexus aggregans]ACL23615.1 conserved hypothetical protein [Chloroflexus aggregans DSM 9485]
MKHRTEIALALLTLFVALALAACGGGQSSPQVKPASTAVPPAPTTAPAAEPAAEQTAASAALTIPCAELVPADELARMIGVKPDNLMETVMLGWTACTWFYTPTGASQQSEFTVQAYTGEETLVKWRMDTDPANRLAGVTVNSLADYVQEGYTWVIPESKLRAVQALQDGRYVFLRFPADNLVLSTESQIADYLAVLFRRLKEKG